MGWKKEEEKVEVVTEEAELERGEEDAREIVERRGVALKHCSLCDALICTNSRILELPDKVSFEYGEDVSYESGFTKRGGDCDFVRGALRLNRR